MAPEASGRVLQVNISPGGVPKRPVAEAWVGRLGLVGDGHAEPTEHGGPLRAVCLFASEAIRRVAAEGHPIAPGSCGENLTTEGLELGLLAPGTRLAVGERLVLEVSKPVTPCKTIAGSFSDGRFARISPAVRPADARIYARVLVEGPVRPGDAIRVLPPHPDSDAGANLLLDRIEAAERFADRERWQAAARLGWPIEVVDDGELAIGASSALSGPAFNWADGLRTVPHVMDRVVGTFRRVGSAGWLPVPREGLPDGVPHPATRWVGRLGVFAIEPDRVRAAEPSDRRLAAGVRGVRVGGVRVGGVRVGGVRVGGVSIRGVRVGGVRVGGVSSAGVRVAGASVRGVRGDGVPVAGPVVVRESTRAEAGVVGALLAGPGRGCRSVGQVLAALPALPGHTALLALVDAQVVGATLVVVRRRVGLVRHLAVAGKGVRAAGSAEVIEAALLNGAAELVAELGCDLVAGIGWLGPGRLPVGLARAGILRADPLVAGGLVRIAERRLVRLAAPNDAAASDEAVRG